MKILLLSKFGDTAAVCQRFISEGHDVRLWIRDMKYKPQLDGIIQQVRSIGQGIAYKPDLVVAGETELTREADIFRNERFNVFGCTEFCDFLEDDRVKAAAFAEDQGLNVPETIGFKEVGKGISFLQSADDRYIVKCDASDEHTSFLGKSNDDVISFLKRVKPDSFILQRYIENLGEVNREIWFSSGRPIYPPNFTMEQKRFLAGDLGPNTGCMSSVVWWPEEGFDHPLVRATWGKGFGSLGRYTGVLDIALLIDHDHQPWFIEFTPRFGISALYALLHIMKDDFGEFLLECVNGKAESMDLEDNTYAFAMNVSIPPYPYDMPNRQMPNQVIDLSFGADDCTVWLHDVYRREGEFKSAGTLGNLFDICVSDPEPQIAIEKAKEYVREMEISQVQYRTDAGEQINKKWIIEQPEVMDAVGV